MSGTDERRPGAVSSAEWLARRRAEEQRGPKVEREARNLRRRARLRLTIRGWVSLAVGALALLVAYTSGRREVLVVAGAAILLPLIGLLVVRLRRPSFDVSRVFSPPVVAAGGVATVTLRIRNTGPSASTALVWNDAVPWEGDDTAPHPLDPIPAGSPSARLRTARYDLHPPRRGVYALGPLVVEHRDPFGMAASTSALGEQDRLVVIPAVEELGPGGPTLADGEGAAQLVQRRVSGNDDDLTTREYRAGDALRRVHWRASARHGELMVRQEEHRSHPDARLVLDTRVGGYPDARSDTGASWDPATASDSFEWVVRMAASLGIHLEANGFRVAIEESAGTQIEQLGERWEGGRRAEGFLTSLAGVRLLDRPATELGAAAPDAAGPVFAMIGDPEEVTVDWLVRRRRGADLAVAFAVRTRAEVLTRLREAGWVVVEVGPREQAGAAWRAVSQEAGYVHGAR